MIGNNSSGIAYLITSFRHENLLNLTISDYNNLFKVRLSLSKKDCVICFNENPLKVMKNAFYFILEPLFVHEIFKFMPLLFGHVGKDLIRN